MRDVDKKDVVESCLILDTSAWKQAGILRPGVLRGGYWRWPWALTLGYILDTRDFGEAMLGLLEPTSQTGVFQRPRSEGRSVAGMMSASTVRPIHCLC